MYSGYGISNDSYVVVVVVGVVEWGVGGEGSKWIEWDFRFKKVL